MNRRLVEDMWYLLNMYCLMSVSNGVGYVVLSIVVMICVRLSLWVSEHAMNPLSKRRAHPLPDPLEQLTVDHRSDLTSRTTSRLDS